MYVFISIYVYTMFWRKNKNTIVSSILQFVTLWYLYLLGPNTFKYLKYILKNNGISSNRYTLHLNGSYQNGCTFFLARMVNWFERNYKSEIEQGKISTIHGSAYIKCFYLLSRVLGPLYRVHLVHDKAWISWHTSFFIFLSSWQSGTHQLKPVYLFFSS
jgi:hypothetical protein